MIKEVILQGGNIKCPICGNKFKWSYKLELISTPELESMNKIASSVSSTPHQYIRRIATEQNTIRFSIGCMKCGTEIETNTMELIDKENYEENKK